MGYAIEQTGAQFRMWCAQQKFALAALKKVDPRDAQLHQAKHLDEAMLQWGAWKLSLDEDYNVNGITFMGDRLGHYVWQSLEAIAQYVVAGSYVEMRGEAGEMWRWVFDGLQCIRVDAKVTIEWPEMPGEGR